MATNTEQIAASPSSKSSFLPGRSSPRSSVDAPSPFLQNLHHRFRKASNASHTSNDAAQAPSPIVGPSETTTKSRSEASRNAKRYLLEVVKDDWEYPQPEDVNKDMMRRDASSWRKREEGMSDVENEAEGRRRSRALSDPYKFEGPESVGEFVEEKKRKRRKLVQDERSWNLGYNHWWLQRDDWTGATMKKPEGRRKARLSRLHGRNESGGTEDSAPLSATSEATSQPDLSSSIDSVDDGTDEGPWLPIYPPLFDEDNILRSRIQPSAYPTIYSKVVVQSLTPNIPIPLTHMTKVLVEGWKSEGAWPPGGATQVAAKDVKTGRKSSAFLRWRNGREEGKEGKRERVRKSIGFMKKAVVGTKKEEVVNGGQEADADRDVGIDFEGETGEEEREERRVY